MLDGYLDALAGAEPIAVLNACATLWRDVDSRQMPTPAAVIAQIRREARDRASKHLLGAPEIPEDEHLFGLECFKVLERMTRKEIARVQAEAEMDALAGKMLRPDALRRYNASAQEVRGGCRL